MSLSVFFSKKLLICVSKSSHKSCVIHLIVLPLQAFLECFLQPVVFTVSFTASIMLDNFISSGDLLRKYPPDGPLELLTKSFLFSFKKICSKKDRDIPCLN